MNFLRNKDYEKAFRKSLFDNEHLKLWGKYYNKDEIEMIKLYAKDYDDCVEHYYESGKISLDDCCIYKEEEIQKKSFFGKTKTIIKQVKKTYGQVLINFLTDDELGVIVFDDIKGTLTFNLFDEWGFLAKPLEEITAMCGFDIIRNFVLRCVAALRKIWNDNPDFRLSRFKTEKLAEIYNHFVRLYNAEERNSELNAWNFINEEIYPNIDNKSWWNQDIKFFRTF